MIPSPSIRPADHHQRDIYLVFELLGGAVAPGGAGKALTLAKMSYRLWPVRLSRLVILQSVGWLRDATSDVADALAQRAADTDVEVSPALQDFIAANATKALRHAAERCPCAESPDAP